MSELQIERLPPQNPSTAAKRASEVAKANPEVGFVRPTTTSTLERDKTVMKILTAGTEGESHHLSELTIDWTGITIEGLFSLARNALVADAMCRMQKAKDFPENVKIVAAEHVHKPSASVCKYEYTPPALKVPKEVESYLLNLSNEEREALKGMFK